MVEGYNEMADFCYSHLTKNDKVILQGYLRNERSVIKCHLQTHTNLILSI